jgi:DNA-binding transcriptional regulator YbjK
MPRSRRAVPGLPATPAGSTGRGSARRDLLVEAATAILETSGYDAVSHRAVATRAALPLAATTYYFSSRDELVRAATRRLGDAYLERARSIVESLPAPPRTPDEVARVLVSLVATDGPRADPHRLLTFYERYVQAGRHPMLRPVVRSWTTELSQLVQVVLHRYEYPMADGLARTIVATIDGLLLDALIDGDERAPVAAAAGVAQMLTLLTVSRDE